MTRRPEAPAGDFNTTASRPASQWPMSSRAPFDQSTTAALTRFDPLAEERDRLRTQAAAAFDVCHPALALRAVLLVQAVLLVASLAAATGLADWLSREAVLAFGGVAGTLVWLVSVCALRPVLSALDAAARSAAVLGLGAAAGMLAWLPLWAAGLAGDAQPFRLAAIVLTGFGMALLLWVWLDLRARIWHPAHASARLAELQSRIRPHFLFNALNTALALVRVDPERAENVLQDLAELFRVALAEAGASVSLQDEIELARRYLAIEQVRFGSRMQVRWDIEPRVHSARVPPLVLQPLVENAVRHGIEPATSGGVVVIRAQVQRGQVVVVVSNTLSEEPGSPGHGMALHNVRERLRLLHDMAGQCDVWRDDGPDGDMFHARLVVPAA